jgi:hypothetical protein
VEQYEVEVQVLSVYSVLLFVLALELLLAFARELLFVMLPEGGFYFAL